LHSFSSCQDDIYEETVRALVTSVLDGFNGTIFAYGQTGTGKTYTMEGWLCQVIVSGFYRSSSYCVREHSSCRGSIIASVSPFRPSSSACPISRSLKMLTSVLSAVYSLSENTSCPDMSSVSLQVVRKSQSCGLSGCDVVLLGECFLSSLCSQESSGPRIILLGPSDP